VKRRQEAEGRRQEAGGRRQEAGGRKQEAGSRKQLVYFFLGIGSFFVGAGREGCRFERKPIVRGSGFAGSVNPRIAAMIETIALS